jgi:hypothetical protein
MEKTKVKTILEWHTPKSKNDVHVWHGFCNFYRRYIKGYSSVAKPFVTTRYGLLHYANLIRRTGLICFLFNLLNLATPLLSYAVRLVLPILVPLSSLPYYLYDAVLILTSDILYSLIDTFLSILRYISTHVFVVEP